MRDTDYKELYKDRNGNVTIAEFERDMRRLDGLLNQYKTLGLNSVESSEAKKLREKYNMEHLEWYQKKYHSE